MALPHATKPECETYLSEANVARTEAWSGGEWERQLERASDIVDNLTGRANYRVDANGLAADPTLRKALSQATCAVIEMWLEVGEENDIDGLAGQQISVTGYSGARAPESTERIRRPLRRAGLLTQPEILP